MSSPIQHHTADNPPPWQARAEELMLILRGPDDDVEALWRAALELGELLPAEDGQPMETPWHRAAPNQLIDSLTHHWRDRDDYYVGANMFIYYLDEDEPLPQSKGPDFFVVRALRRNKNKKREKWVVFNEEKFPHVIIEFLSPSTSRKDRTTKKDVYEQIFETDEYYLYDPKRHTLEGWRLNSQGQYEAIQPNDRGWMWSERLQLWIGFWVGKYQEMEDTWPRFFDAAGNLIPTVAEAEQQRAKAEYDRAEAEQQRAVEYRKEIEELKKKIAELERGQKNG